MEKTPLCQKVRAMQIPRARGTYVLILRLVRARRIQVGSLGRFCFPGGWFGYVGSAFGPGGLRGRLGHHLNPSAPSRWHVDYLREVAPLEQVWLAGGEEVQEHVWAGLLREGMQGEVPVPGFGSSDCRCEAHLFRFQDRPSWHSFRALLSHRFRTESSALKSESDAGKGEEEPMRFLIKKGARPDRRGDWVQKG
jgi:Uri superfamily endonuclease